MFTDPSYAGQIITFTFPHIGNVCDLRAEVIETVNMAATPGARGVVLRTRPSPIPRATGRRGISTSGSRRAASSGSPASTPAR